MKISFSLVITLIIISTISPVLAQSGSFSRLGFSPRGMAMGNAMTAVDHEGSYGYYNPAMAAKPSDVIQVDFSTAALQFDRRLNMINTHFQLPPMAGFSLSFLHAGVGNIDGRTLSGYHTEMLSTAEYQLTGNFGLRFNDSIWGGIGIKYNLTDYHPEIPLSSGIGIDIGIRATLTSKLTLGIAIKDLLSENNIDTSELYGTDPISNNSEVYPSRFLSGVAYTISDKWLVSLDFEQRIHSANQVRTISEVVNGFEQTRITRDDVRYSRQFLRLGNRYHIHERLTLRAGLQFHDLSEENSILPAAGFSLLLPFDRLSPSIDYAIMREPNQISNMHVFSLRLNI